MGQNDSLHDTQFVPKVAGGVIAVLVSLAAIIAALAGRSSPAPAALEEESWEAKGRLRKRQPMDPLRVWTAASQVAVDYGRRRVD